MSVIEVVKEETSDFLHNSVLLAGPIAGFASFLGYSVFEISPKEAGKLAYLSFFTANLVDKISKPIFDSIEQKSDRNSRSFQTFAQVTAISFKWGVGTLLARELIGFTHIGTYKTLSLVALALLASDLFTELMSRIPQK